VQGCGTHASFGSGGVLGQETNAAGTCGATQPLYVEHLLKQNKYEQINILKYT